MGINCRGRDNFGDLRLTGRHHVACRQPEGSVLRLVLRLVLVMVLRSAWCWS